MTEIETQMMIGGPMDGERLGMEVEQDWIVVPQLMPMDAYITPSDPEDFEDHFVRYLKQSFTTDTHRYWFWLIEGMDISTVIGRLFRHYTPHEHEQRTHDN